MAGLAPRPRQGGAALTNLLLGAALLVALVFAVRSHLLLHSSSTEVFMDRPDWGAHRSHHARREGPGATHSRLPGGGSDGGSAAWKPAKRSGPPVPAEVWAGHLPADLAAQQGEVRKLVGAGDAQALEALCGRCLLHQFKLMVGYDNAHKVGGW